MRFACAAAALGILFLSLGCQTRQTRVTESDARFETRSGGEASSLEPIELTRETAVVDVRLPFDFASSRLPRSVLLQWSDFTERSAEEKGVLQADLFEIARRLARVGIGPETPVVVVGYGAPRSGEVGRGGGEEGRMAWMLRYLGVKNVRFASIDSFPGPFTSRNPFPSPDAPLGVAADASVAPEPAPKNAPLWRPVADESFIATGAEVRSVIDDPTKAKGYVFVDVRPAKDYLGSEGFGASHRPPNMGAINIPWPEFIDSKGRVSCSAVHKLRRFISASGAPADKRFILFDEFGVASGGAAIALRACGLPNAANYAGGLRDLFASPR